MKGSASLESTSEDAAKRHMTPGNDVEGGALELAEAYREHYRSLVRFLYRRTGDQAEAEDLAQEAFVRALEHRPERPRPWLYRVATNLVRDAGRKKAVRRRHLSLVQDEQDRSGAPGPEVELSRRQTVARVRAALEELSSRDRDCLLLQEEGLSYEEIAAVTGLAVGSIGTTLSRARRRLAEAFEAIEDEGGRMDRRGGS